MMYRSACSCGADFRFNTKAEQLVTEGPRVTGVVVSDREGYKKINPEKASSSPPAASRTTRK
jgi:hypothetical protein